MRNDEATQIRFVRDRLTEHYPQVSPGIIAEIIARAQAALTDARVRTFVPLLVERRARIELSAVTSGAILTL
ncbi:three-helix bundle dimerization domain-containing protein [Nocardia sp. NPDC046763]|uniref:three-helix bundle dimerization domain-containing protein n=1 Tax=Nocardia sp. NPDC046763 TaxID=3155256 RepID=UPI0033EB31B3